MNYVSGVYFSNWSVYESKHFPLDVDVSKLSHVFYAFMKIDPNSGKVSLSDPWADTELLVDGRNGCLGLWKVLKEKNRHVKVLMSVGGWGAELAFQQTVKSETKLSIFVESVGELVQKFKFDGVDIDWEYPASHEEGMKMCELLEFLRQTLDSIRSGLLITVAAPAGNEHLQNYNMARMDKVLSFWNVMCYDFAGAGWSSKTAYHLNLYGCNGDNKLSVDDVIAEYSRQGIHPQKIVIGMPMYGRSFYSPTSVEMGVQFDKNLPYPSDTVPYRDITYGNEQFDSLRVGAHFYDEQKSLLITYDNPQCAVEKSKYVQNHNLLGGFWWDSKGESDVPSRMLIDAFVQQLGGASELDHSPNWI